MLIAGTVPIKNMPLVCGTVISEDEYLVVDGQRIPLTQGTGAMLSAALTTTRYLGIEPPKALLVGDIGDGKGSYALYQYLTDNITAIAPKVLALHYWLPRMQQTRKLCQAVSQLTEHPKMIADAASMYSAKAAGLAGEFDIFTPDASEVAFLADSEASHPAYIAKHLFETEAADIPELTKTAYRNHDAASLLLVKGATDYIFQNNGDTVTTVSEPDIPELEAIGGTGDTITGMVTAFVAAGLEAHEAAIIAAKANRIAGKYAEATPATGVWQIIDRFPEVFKEYLCRWSQVCYIKGEESND